jgi:3-phosphoglycerate kinase
MPRAVGDAINRRGDTIYAFNKLCIAGKFDHISTGGEASLKLLENGALPCLDVLDRV